jgi:hypothetical protein
MMKLSKNLHGRTAVMVHLYFKSCHQNQSAFKVAGSGNAPAGCKPVDQPWRRFHFEGGRKYEK